MLSRRTGMLFGLILLLAAPALASAPAPVKQQAMTAHYRLELQIGPVEKISLPAAVAAGIRLTIPHAGQRACFPAASSATRNVRPQPVQEISIGIGSGSVFRFRFSVFSFELSVAPLTNY